MLEVVDTAALGVFEEDGGGSVLEDAFEQVDLVAFLGFSHVLAVEVCAFVEGLVFHPEAVEGSLAVAFGQAGPHVHALALDQFQFGVHFEDLLLGEDLFLVLDDGGGKGLEGLAGGLSVLGLHGADADLVDLLREEAGVAFGAAVVGFCLHASIINLYCIFRPLRKNPVLWAQARPLLILPDAVA